MEVQLQPGHVTQLKKSRGGISARLCLRYHFGGPNRVPVLVPELYSTAGYIIFFIFSIFIAYGFVEVSRITD